MTKSLLFTIISLASLVGISPNSSAESFRCIGAFDITTPEAMKGYIFIDGDLVPDATGATVVQSPIKVELLLANGFFDPAEMMVVESSFQDEQFLNLKFIAAKGDVPVVLKTTFTEPGPNERNYVGDLIDVRNDLTLKITCYKLLPL